MVLSFAAMGPWILFVALPRMLWNIFRDTDLHDIKEWEMPYYPIYFL